tara:strand:+ start:219 stop:416 length:198 start_codon:yes stop_codon:yes gene_type:complete
LLCHFFSAVESALASAVEFGSVGRSGRGIPSELVDGASALEEDVSFKARTFTGFDESSQTPLDGY